MLEPRPHKEKAYPIQNRCHGRWRRWVEREIEGRLVRVSEKRVCGNRSHRIAPTLVQKEDLYSESRCFSHITPRFVSRVHISGDRWLCRSRILFEPHNSQNARGRFPTIWRSLVKAVECVLVRYSLVCTRIWVEGRRSVCL